MSENFKKDYLANNKGFVCALILFFYRLGNKIFYSEINSVMKKILLKSVNILNLLFIYYPFKVDIPFKCKIGGGLRLVHPSGIYINGDSVIGENCVIYQQVTVGINELSDKKGAPHIGNNVFIGAGAKIIGEINIGDNCKIGANAVVVKDLQNDSTAVCRQFVL